MQPNDEQRLLQVKRRGSAAESGAKPRIVAYCVSPWGYRILSQWAERHEHRFVLLITTPGPTRARDEMYREVVAAAPPYQDILVTIGMRRVAPIIASLEPDLILSFTFPFRIPPEVLSIPRLGAVNLHPSPLPAYRGPDPARMIFNGEPLLGATLHRTEAEYDTGAILSQHTAPMPEEVTPKVVLEVWGHLLAKSLDEGVANALAGEPGLPQDPAKASYAASFSDEEFWLDWALPSAMLQRHAAALNLFSTRARATIDGRHYLVSDLRATHAESTARRPGTVLDRTDGVVTLRTGDGAIRAIIAPLD